MPDLGLGDLVANRTMSREIAATLRRAVLARRSFLIVALPRRAGKSTVGRAMLAVAAGAGAPIRELGTDGADVASVAGAARGGYLHVPEVSQYPVAAGYVWGAPVRRAFAAIANGTALSTALHADSAAGAVEVLRANRVPDDDLARLDLIVHCRSLGDWREPVRRVVADVHEVVDVKGGVADMRLVHRWDEARDRFEDVAAPARF